MYLPMERIPDENCLISICKMPKVCLSTTFPAFIVLDDDLLEPWTLLDEPFDLKQDVPLASSLDKQGFPEGVRQKCLSFLLVLLE